MVAGQALVENNREPYDSSMAGSLFSHDYKSPSLMAETSGTRTILRKARTFPITMIRLRLSPQTLA